MTKLTWGNVGERFYEAGTDRGVLYIPGMLPIAWDGLTAVKESSSGGSAQPFYLDGFKYLNISTNEEFEATIEAFASPKEFAVCDGSGFLGNGLYITQQPRKSFDFSYRSRIGNDLESTNHGYKIHIVYNALAAPTSRDYSTIGDSQTPMTLSWKITTLANTLSGFKPSAHFVIDSTQASEEALFALENALYGTETSSPRMPQPSELVKMFEPFVPFTVELLGNGRYTAEGTAVQIVDSGRFTIEHETITDNGNGSFSIE